VSSGAIDPEAMAWQPVDHALAIAVDAADEVVQDAVWQAMPPLQPLAASTTQPASRLPEETSLQQQLGQVVHRVLEWLTVVPVAQRTDECVERAAITAAREVQLASDQVVQAIRLANTILRAPALQTWLDPAGLAWAGNEVALHDQGQVLRIDRLVARDTPQGREWWVLDYKLQHRPEALAAYRQQLTRYVAAVSALQPGDRVNAAFITSAGECVPLTV